MGEARRKQIEKNEIKSSAVRLSDEDLVLAGKALASVIGAITQSHGADCVMYAGVGANFLSALGVPAKMVIGSAAWRVGPGAGDVISHALEINAPGSPMYAPDGSQHPGGQALTAGMFHAWIESGDEIIDFTTGELHHKARQLDSMDGGRTQVDWAPAALRTPAKQSASFEDVVNAYDGGVFAYRRNPTVEKAIIDKHVSQMDLEGPAVAVLTAYRAMKAGSRIQVIGLGEGAEQTLESARKNSFNLRKL